MHKQNLLELTAVILRSPTAPFHERRVRATIAGLLSELCPHVDVREDAFGNLIAHYRGGEGQVPRYAFAAHMDHPAWVRPPEGGDLEFLGGVPQPYLDANRERIEHFGSFAMWALPAFETREERVYSRACDDLIGCAAMVSMFCELEAGDCEADCYALFTRAEEVGFAGAIHMARDGWLAEAGLTVVSLETSAERPPARMGAGPIVRVGDRTSVFSPEATGELLDIASSAKIEVQRCLMAGGTCEATAFQAFGIRSAGLCIALGNYHNCAPGAPRIEPEYVSIHDYEQLVNLCVEIARSRRDHAAAIDPASRLRETLVHRIDGYRAYFTRDRAHATERVVAA